MSGRAILVDVRDVYGRETIYPACPTAELLAQLAGTRTLTRAALATIRALGYSVAVRPHAGFDAPAAGRVAAELEGARHWTGGPLTVHVPGLIPLNRGRV